MGDTSDEENQEDEDEEEVVLVETGNALGTKNNKKNENRLVCKNRFVHPPGEARDREKLLYYLYKTKTAGVAPLFPDDGYDNPTDPSACIMWHMEKMSQAPAVLEMELSKMALRLGMSHWGAGETSKPTVDEQAELMVGGNKHDDESEDNEDNSDDGDVSSLAVESVSTFGKKHKRYRLPGESTDDMIVRAYKEEANKNGFRPWGQDRWTMVRKATFEQVFRKVKIIFNKREMNFGGSIWESLESDFVWPEKQVIGHMKFWDVVRGEIFKGINDKRDGVVNAMKEVFLSKSLPKVCVFVLLWAWRLLTTVRLPTGTRIVVGEENASWLHVAECAGDGTRHDQFLLFPYVKIRSVRAW